MTKTERHRAASDWDFVCEWYREDVIAAAIRRSLDPPLPAPANQIPKDVTSTEFAVWLTHQYRLAMKKGMELKEQELKGTL